MIAPSSLRGYLLLVLACVLSAHVSQAGSKPLRIGFLCPETPKQGFWSQVIDVMQAAAKDLDVELQVKCDQTGSVMGSRLVGYELLTSEPKLDYFLTGYLTSVTRFHLTLAESQGIKTFLINGDIREDEKKEFKGPRDVLGSWIGRMVPDDKAGAIELTRILIDHARQIKKKNSVDAVNVYAFVGEGWSTVAHKRNTGLFQQIEKMPTAKLHKAPLTFWRGNDAKGWVASLLNKSLEVDVVWSGSQDGMWGAVQGVEQVGKIPGKDVIIGGFDWNSESIEAIADGRITASMFGHFMEGAWALILVHDHHYGFDFKNDTGVSISTPLTVIKSENCAKYRNVINKEFWDKVDFRKVSKKYNPNLKTYNFNINQFLGIPGRPN